MEFKPGAKLGPYEIVSRIGAGGMGEVWKARDPRLNRIVAIKTSHVRFSDRFEREARAVAALNHPHICQIYDVGPDYLVMEFIEGAEIKGPLPLEQALKYAIQLSSALEAAHKKLITHRDLKPANILIAKSGVKVLDFGLAKTGQTPEASANDETLTRALTQEGSIVGTLQYMAPEQLQGKVTDVRADIFSFGCVLYEMLTGKRAFDGANTASVIAAILERPAPSVAEVAPPLLDWTLRRCLAKDPDGRWQSAADLQAALERIAESGAVAGETRLPARFPWVACGVAVAGFIAAAGLAFIHFRETPPEVRPARFVVAPPGDAQFRGPYAATAISPDGRYLVFGAGQPGSGRGPLWLRPIDSLNARQLPGTEGGNFPFWSPDSKSIAFLSSDRKLTRSDIAGGAPQVLCDTADVPASAGGTWNRDGIILFGSDRGLFRVPASGGVPVQVTKTDTARRESEHGDPQFLPDGEHFLYFVRSPDPNVQGIYAGSLEGPAPDARSAPARILATDRKAYYAPSLSGQTGYLMWMRDQTLLAQPFDAKKLRLEGAPTPVVDGLTLVPPVRAPFWISDAGLLAYRSGGLYPKGKLVWMSREGKTLSEAGQEDRYGSLRLSPDGKHLAVSRIDDSGNEDIWVLEFGREVMQRLTFDPKQDAQPVWSPDGRQIAWTSDRSGVHQIYRKDAGGGGQEEQLTNGPYDKLLTDWSRDGRYLLYYEVAPRTGFDILALPLEGERKPVPVLQTPFSEQLAQFSPDGKWIAYQSNESGRFEIYVRAFPVSQGGPRQVSNEGGLAPKWRADGKELYYLGLNRSIMAAGIRTSEAGVQPGVEVDTPRQLFAVGLTLTYDVSADGQRFLVIQPSSAQQGLAPLTVVLNWQAGLKK